MKKLEPLLAEKLVGKFLTDDLRKPKYQGHPNKYHGHCYTGAECLFHLIPKRLGFRPRVVRCDDGDTHWFLARGKEILDPTKGQFDSLAELKHLYDTARPCGFLTKQPSKRAKILISRIRRHLRETKKS